MRDLRRLPIGPLLDRFPDTDFTAMADACGLDRRTFLRYRALGVPVVAADRIAVTLGLHPALVWGREWFEEVDA